MTVVDHTRVSGGPLRDETENLDDAVLAARQGDEAAFARVWETLHPPLLRYLTLCGEESPEDVAAETWLQVVRGLARFEGGEAQFRSWLFTIARHRAVDHGRGRRRRPVTVELAAASPVRLATVASAEDDVLDHDATTEALRLVATLPPAQAEMVALRVVAGLEVAEVARLVGKRPGAVRVAVHRALKTLAAGAPSQPHHPTPDTTTRKAV